MSHQDWETVTIRAKRNPAYNLLNSSGSGCHPVISHEARIARELDSDNIVVPTIKRLNDESRRKIISVRSEKGLDQKTLNMMCAFPKNTIRDIESGHAHPSPKQLVVLNNVLGISLKYE
jgi:ribosome-binding protein aMBF1 (putative translation factor)